VRPFSRKMSRMRLRFARKSAPERIGPDIDELEWIGISACARVYVVIRSRYITYE
jgi:hypothetical protein